VGGSPECASTPSRACEFFVYAGCVSVCEASEGCFDSASVFFAFAVVVRPPHFAAYACSARRVFALLHARLEALLEREFVKLFVIVRFVGVQIVGRCFLQQFSSDLHVVYAPCGCAYGREPCSVRPRRVLGYSMKLPELASFRSALVACGTHAYASGIENNALDFESFTQVFCSAFCEGKNPSGFQPLGRPMQTTLRNAQNALCFTESPAPKRAHEKRESVLSRTPLRRPSSLSEPPRIAYRRKNAAENFFNLLWDR